MHAQDQVKQVVLLNDINIIDISLMTAGPNVRVDQCRTVATAQESLMAESILANFLKLGNGGGSYAMSSSMQDMFVLAMKKYLDNISNVINNEAIPALMKLNGMDTRYAPKLTHEGLDTDSVGVFVDALVKSVQSGVIVPTKDLQRTVLTKLKAPTTGSDSAWEETEKMQKELMEATKKQAEAAEKAPAAPGTNKGTPEKVQKKNTSEIFEIAGKFFVVQGEEIVEVV